MRQLSLIGSDVSSKANNNQLFSLVVSKLVTQFKEAAGSAISKKKRCNKTAPNISVEKGCICLEGRQHKTAIRCLRRVDEVKSDVIRSVRNKPTDLVAFHIHSTRPWKHCLQLRSKRETEPWRWISAAPGNAALSCDCKLDSVLV